MALDFGEFSVTDPHDPDFHQTLAGERVVVYYGTTSAHFWEVIKHGVSAGPTVRRKHPNHNDLTFDQGTARDIAYRKASAENKDDDNGPVKPMVFVLEVKFERPYQAGASEMDQFIAGTDVGAEMNTILPLKIKPNAITGVYYDDIQNNWEMPIKKFIEKVNWGQVEGIEPDPSFKRSKYRPTGPTKEAWQFIVLRYVNDLLNYSSNYFQYLVSDQVPKPYNDTVIKEATKVGLQNMLNWTGKDFMEWVYKILPIPISEPDHTKEEDIAQVMNNGDYNGWNRPFYQLFKKYNDNTAWEYRSGRKGPHSPGGE